MPRTSQNAFAGDNPGKSTSSARIRISRRPIRRHSPGLECAPEAGFAFHIVDQFQVFIAGSGTIGRDQVHLVTVHYADHHTGYGPLIAGAQGLSYLTLRSKTDAGLVYLTTPNVREKLKPTKRRHRVSPPVALSIEPVLRDRTTVSIDTVVEEQPGDDGIERQGHTPWPFHDGSGSRPERIWRTISYRPQRIASSRRANLHAVLAGLCALEDEAPVLMAGERRRGHGHAVST